LASSPYIEVGKLSKRNVAHPVTATAKVAVQHSERSAGPERYRRTERWRDQLQKN
jgi:hypothetical protein